MKNSIVVVAIIYLCCAVHTRAGDNPRTVHAVRVSTPPRIDGILDDAVWNLAEPTADFIQRDPDEGKPASERTEIRVLYDDEALYFGCMYYDSEPEKIISRLTRHDNEIETDRASIHIDSYHDHQTGYEFAFSSAGVKIDILQYDDANRSDDSWDPVWDVQTKILPNGWCAEIKIPFRVLHYRSTLTDSAETVWGINFLRIISRKQELEQWAFIPKSQTGFISRFGHLVGLQHLPEPRSIEILPFMTGKQSYTPAVSYQTRKQEFTGNAGLDLKYGISSNFTLDATINPDFGQVEADPAVLNLSTYETFYPEKRPFFIEGTQILHFTTFGGGSGPGMFYSRRIGRAMDVSEVNTTGVKEILDLPQRVAILGAAKVSGKTNGGLAVGILEAFTQEEKATVVNTLGAKAEQVLEPFAHYNIVRLKQDVLDNSNVGMIMTSVEKHNRYPAFTNGYDWNLLFGRNTYLLNGFLAFSRTTNSDNERITGSAGKLDYSKIAGEHWLWSLSSDYTSKQYNIDDAGFFFSPNDFGGVITINYKEDVPAELVRNYNAGISLHYRDNFDRVDLFRQISFNGGMLFSNYWSFNASASGDFGLYDARETRGNGLYRKPRSYAANANLVTDGRNDIVLSIGQQFDWDSKLKQQWQTSVGIKMKPLPWIEWDIQSDYQHVQNQEAWVQNLESFAIFGDRSTDQYNITLRSTITFTREITLQLYGQIFFAKGHYQNFRQLTPGTGDFIPYYASALSIANPDFNRKSLNTNMVFRWEYLPGSTLFLVWSQARAGDNGNYFTTFGNNLDDTFRLPPSNVLLLKVSYYCSL